MRTGSAVVAVSAVLTLSACSDVDGVRVMGRTEPVASTVPSTTSGVPGSLSVDPVRLLRGDPKVGRTTKDALQPCPDGKPAVAGKYPVETIYGDVTGDGQPDIVINVYPCSAAGTSGVGSTGGPDSVPVHAYLGGYVYTMRDGRPVEIFALENTASRLQIFNGHLAAMQAVYRAGDPPCCPSDGTVVNYRWAGTGFVPDTH